MCEAFKKFLLNIKYLDNEKKMYLLIAYKVTYQYIDSLENYNSLYLYT